MLMTDVEFNKNSFKMDIDIFTCLGDGPGLSLLVDDKFIDCRNCNVTGESCGVFDVNMEDLFIEYLQKGINDDGGKSSMSLVKLLRKYADKIESAARKNK